MEIQNYLDEILDEYIESYLWSYRNLSYMRFSEEDRKKIRDLFESLCNNDDDYFTTIDCNKFWHEFDSIFSQK